MKYKEILFCSFAIIIVSVSAIAQNTRRVSLNYTVSEQEEYDSTDHKSSIIEMMKQEMTVTEVLNSYFYLTVVDSTYLNKIPSINPLQLSENPYISSLYGFRYHPIKKLYKKHNGIDLACNKGFQFVYATADGIVSRSGYYGDLGLSVTINHPTGFTTKYGHLSGIFVRANATVKIGEVIGVMGQTGMATGIHLHYCVSRDGINLNPLPYLTLYQEFKQKRDAFKASLN